MLVPARITYRRLLRQKAAQVLPQVSNFDKMKAKNRFGAGPQKVRRTMSPKKGYIWVRVEGKNPSPKKPKQRKPPSKSYTDPQKNPAIIYELEVTLQNVEPRVWRLFTVPGTITLRQLHEALLAVMGWTGGHLWEFDIGTHYGDPAAGDASLQRADSVILQDVISRRDSVFDYVYDWGDEWHHRIKVRDIRHLQAGERSPAILEGANACPPEDVGGVPGYAMFLEAIEDPDHPEHEEMLEWVGGKWNPKKFDRKAHQRNLSSRAKLDYWAQP